MIIVHIFGGLGNQLFQYAAGRTIAEKYQQALKLDISEFKNYDLRNFDLSQLNTHFGIANEDEIKLLKPSSNISKAWQYLKPKKKRTYHREHFFHYDKSFEKIGPDVYLKGYFQSEKYFAPATNTIRKEFVIKSELLTGIEEVAASIRNTTSVSVHIRRGDYKNKKVLTLHGILDISYYQQAIETVLQQHPDAVFYFFSDDIEWVKENFAIPGAVFVSRYHSRTHFEDLHLMSLCKHNIIANSSFSWWGAWLNNNAGKMVIGPKKWFNKGPEDTQDILPGNWIRI